jgi:predicted Zn-dependent peptidase
MTHPMLHAVLTQQLAAFDSKYVLPNEQFRALEQSDAKVIQKICNKYLSFDNYVFVSIEPEKNRSEKKIKSTTLSFNRMKVVVEEDPNQDMVGICWSFQVPEKEDPRVAYLAGWAMAAKSHQLKNKTIQQELEKVNPMFPMFMLKDKLTSFGQVSTAYWRNSLHKLLPHMIFGREVLEQDLDLARKIIASQIKKFDGSYKSLEYLYKSTFPEKPIQWFYLWDKAKELDAITIEQVQSYVDRVMIPENCHLVINGNVTAKEAKKLFGKSLKTVMTMDEDSVVESGKKVSLRSRLHQLRKQIKQVSSKAPAMSSLAPVAKCVKKRFKSEGDEFASFVGTIASVDSLSVREHAALVIFGSHFSHVFKSMYADSGISATFYAGSSDLNLPIVMIISGDVEEFPKVEEYLTNALKECEKCGDDTKMQNYIIKAVRLNKNYTNLDRGTYALTANLLLQQGFDSNYMNQLMKNLETMTLKEAHRIFKKAYKKDFKIDFVPEID